MNALLDFSVVVIQFDKLNYNYGKIKQGVHKSVLEDYRIALMSREVSLLGRREVLTGKAKFGIFGDGKEVVQVALAKFFQKGVVQPQPGRAFNKVRVSLLILVNSIT